MVRKASPKTSTAPIAGRATLLAIGLAAATMGAAHAQVQRVSTDAHGERTSLVWDASAVRHLFERAAFGASDSQVAIALARGPEATVDDLLGRAYAWRDVEPELFRWEMFGLDHRQLPLEDAAFYEMSREDQVGLCKDARGTEREQFLELYERWFDAVLDHSDPLRDRMTLFWHGFFTTSHEVNKRKFELIHQFQWLRRTSLESYATLLHGIVRDPAMLQYLDNTSNRAGHPNENLARELMELYSLGEGRYSELDVREAARALSGHAGSAEGTYEFLPEHHDAGEKTILGVRGPHDAADLVDILLARPECAEWVSRRLLRYFEGVEPEADRLASYAALLRAARYELRPFLQRLFLDPAFYRDGVVAARVSGPIEYLAKACRRLGMRPPSAALHVALEHMGQGLYRPPSVKGWPEGLEWMSTDAVLRRGNCMAVLLGFDPGPGASRELHVLQSCLGDWRWTPAPELVARLQATDVRSDAALARELSDAWLSARGSERVAKLLEELLRREREALGAPADAIGADASLREHLLRRAAHFLFSLPEAQLG